MWPFKKKPLKICKDCIFYMEKIPTLRQCSHFTSFNKSINVVTGDDYIYYNTCVSQREIGNCGLKARYFKPKV